jgi:hypothetical protein
MTWANTYIDDSSSSFALLNYTKTLTPLRRGWHRRNGLRSKRSVNRFAAPSAKSTCRDWREERLLNEAGEEIFVRYKDETTGKVEITSMNHGFAVDQATLPKGATQTHVSLFDGSNCGIQLEGRPVFSVQYHPEASPGPRDSHYLFKRFADLMRANKSA